MTVHLETLRWWIAQADVIEPPRIAPVSLQVRTGLSAAFRPYMLGPLTDEQRQQQVMMAPVVAIWRYTVDCPDAFGEWLATREVLLSEPRMIGDAALKSIRYGGTYRPRNLRAMERPIKPSGHSRTKRRWGPCSACVAKGQGQ